MTGFSKENLITGLTAHEQTQWYESRIGELKFSVNEAMRILGAIRGHVEWVCQHNERLNGGTRSEADRRDLEMIDSFLAGGFE